MTMNPIQWIKTGGLAIAATALAYGAPSTGAFAQQQNPGWAKICTKVGENDICNVQFNILTNTGRLITGVNLLQSKGEINRRIFQIAVPSGRYIPQGIKVKIDNGKENTIPYSICLPERCIAEVPLTDGLVKALKGGGNVIVSSTNFKNEKNPINVTLKGFTAAYDGPPLKRDQVEERNKKLEEELKKKAEETRKKLEEAQKKAKSADN